MPSDFCAVLQERIYDAMSAAKDKPGLYGGRYVARHDDGAIVVLDDDDPEAYPDWDVLVHCRPDKAYGIGRIRHFVLEDGTVQLPE